MILILEERKFRDADDCIKAVQSKAVSLLNEDVWGFDYAMSLTGLKQDTEKFTDEEYEEAIDIDSIRETLEEFDTVIVCGARLNRLLLGVETKGNLLKVTETTNRKYITYYSCVYSIRNNKPIEDALSLAIKLDQENITSNNDVVYELLDTPDKIKNLLDKEFDVVAFDFETNLIKDGALIEYATILSLSFRPGYSYIIPFEHKEPIMDGKKVLDRLEPIFNREELDMICFWLDESIFSNDSVIKIAQNTKFDIKVLWLYEINTGDIQRYEDTMLMCHLLDERLHSGLEVQSERELPYLENYKSNVDYEGPLDQLCYYAARDTDRTLRLWYIYKSRLSSLNKLEVYYENLSKPLLETFAAIEYRGAKVSKPRLAEYMAEAENLLETRNKELREFPEYKAYIKAKNLEKIQAEIEKLELEKKTLKTQKSIDARDERIKQLSTKGIQFYTEVNFGSPQQLSDLIYSKIGLNIKPLKIKGKLEYGTAKEILEELNHPFTNKLSAIRTLAKVISTYFGPLLHNSDRNGYIHPSFKLNGTTTGRLSCTGPNLQNIMGRLSYEDAEVETVIKKIKKCFIPPDDHFILQVDGSQAELRFIANFSKDPVMIDAYLQNKDLHAITGAKIMDMEFEEFKVSENYKQGRWLGKSANFGIVYDISVDGYIAYIKNNTRVVISSAEAQKHIDSIFSTYTWLKKWHKKYTMFAKKHGYVETLLGRRRRFSNINNTTNQGLVNKDIRDAINTPIQGSSGEYFLMLQNVYHKKNLWMFNNVHDAIMFYIKADRKTALRTLKIIEDACNNPPLELFGVTGDKMPVPIKLDYSISFDSWGEVIELGSYNNAIEWVKENIK
jgi:DNA polymerase I